MRTYFNQLKIKNNSSIKNNIYILYHHYNKNSFQLAIISMDINLPVLVNCHWIQFRYIHLDRSYLITTRLRIIDKFRSQSYLESIDSLYKQTLWQKCTGEMQERVCDSIEHLKLDSLVMGSRGLSAIRRYLFSIIPSPI